MNRLSIVRRLRPNRLTIHTLDFSTSQDRPETYEINAISYRTESRTYPTQAYTTFNNDFYSIQNIRLNPFEESEDDK